MIDLFCVSCPIINVISCTYIKAADLQWVQLLLEQQCHAHRHSQRRKRPVSSLLAINNFFFEGTGGARERERWKGNECDTIFVCQIMRCRNKSSGRGMSLDSARTKKRRRKCLPFMKACRSVTLNHNWHKMRWADRQSIDVAGEFSTCKMMGERGDPEKTSNCQLHRQSGYFVRHPVVPFLPFHLLRPTLCR